MSRPPKTPRHGGEGAKPRRPRRDARPGPTGSAAAGKSWPEHPASEPARRGAAAAEDGDRIAKVMARAGLCSRREAEDYIAAGRVAVNGGTISSPAINVTDRDRVTVDGAPLPRPERTRVFLYHKPAGLVTTNADPEGRPTLFDALPKGLPRLMSVGRLDIGTEGLVLLTNDGGLARELELPQTGWVRRYRVRAHGHVGQEELDRLRDGVTVDGVHYGPIEATLERDQGGANVWIAFAIREGKNREVRNVLAHLGLSVNRLIRVEFGPFGLGRLPEGEIEEVESGNLRAQLGPRIVSRAGCDFRGPAAALPAPSREQRREQRHALRGRLRDGSRDHDAEPRPARRSRNLHDDDTATAPPGRPRRGHAWRQEDAPLRRTYRGSRRDDLKIEDRPDKRTGVATDRKGRNVVVERFGEAKPKEKPVAAPGRARRGPPRDRAGGPRPSRPRPPPERGERPEPATGRGRQGRPAAKGRRDSRPAPGPRPRSGGAGSRGAGSRGAGSRGAGSRGGASGSRPSGRPSGRPPRKR